MSKFCAFLPEKCCLFKNNIFSLGPTFVETDLIQFQRKSYKMELFYN